jgi:hypothetical protein
MAMKAARMSGTLMILARSDQCCPIKNPIELVKNSLGRGLFVSKVNLRSPTVASESIMLRRSLTRRMNYLHRTQGRQLAYIGSTTHLKARRMPHGPAASHNR